ncbi:unnamed protein product [Tetraodon nigroviridis]|uniref:(spotted green pufferfish) hypothetical protein n=1 Tax=Tetraodon nigroviridis TaxID=99883 RepID=Q4T9W6_TETNG|nr:unnamed protein product [Tetraodon nigroviridis]
MAPSVGSEGSERADMARVRPGGLALLPWTRQMLTVLWAQIRLLLQVIYYSCMSVFQMFRFEVHVRITDETGQHIQHMSAAANPSDSFLFSTLFEGDSGVMVGGSGHISNFCSEMGDPFAGSLRAEDLCCGLVDGLVSRTSGKEDKMFGAQSSWELGFSGDWNVLGSCSGDPAEEEPSSPWSSEEDQNPFEFDNEESQNLWESLSGSSDPYNPLYFSACTSTRSSQGRPAASRPEDGGGGSSDQVLAPGANQLVSRSDSEISWGSSDGSTLGEEAEQLLQLFSTSDPYDPMCFTACPSTAPPPGPDAPPPPPSEDEEEQLWKSLSARQDPYHPLNFQACLRSGSAEPQKPTRTRARTSRPSLQERASHHRHPETTYGALDPPQEGRRERPAARPRPQEGNSRVRFSPVVHVHVMRSWTFARQASRKGNWEEMARDRDRFQRRIREAEAQLGPCLSPAHRRKQDRQVLPVFDRQGLFVLPKHLGTKARLHPSSMWVLKSPCRSSVREGISGESMDREADHGGASGPGQPTWTMVLRGLQRRQGLLHRVSRTLRLLFRTRRRFDQEQIPEGISAE